MSNLLRSPKWRREQRQASPRVLNVRFNTPVGSTNLRAFTRTMRSYTTLWWMLRRLPTMNMRLSVLLAWRRKSGTARWMLPLTSNRPIPQKRPADRPTSRGQLISRHAQDVLLGISRTLNVLSNPCHSTCVQLDPTHWHGSRRTRSALPGSVKRVLHQRTTG